MVVHDCAPASAQTLMAASFASAASWLSEARVYHGRMVGSRVADGRHQSRCPESLHEQHRARYRVLHRGAAAARPDVSS